MSCPSATFDWSAPTHEVFRRHEIDVVTHVPEGGLKALIERCDQDPRIDVVTLTNESEGPCVLAGAWLGGRRGILLMQGSGVGNCINNFGLSDACRFPVLTLIPLRGTWGEQNPWMLYQGRKVERFLELAGFKVHVVDRPEEVADTLDAAARTVFLAEARVAVILSQRVTGTKEFRR